MIMNLTIIPLGVGHSLSKYVAEMEKIIRASGLKNELHSMGTNIEGGWDEVVAVAKACHEKMFEMGAPRVSTLMSVSDRRDKPYTMEGKIEAVEEKLA